MIRERRIWIITEFYFPIVTSTGYYITEIAEFLALNKSNIHVICTSAKYNEKETIDTCREEFRNGVYIHRILTKNIDKDKFFSRIIRLIGSSVRLIFKILFSVKKIDEVLLVTNPAFLLLLMPFIKLLKGVNYKILVHDIFPENLVAIGIIQKSSFLYKFTKKMFDSAYSQAEICIAIGKDMREVIFSKIKDYNKINLITNWADIEDVKPLEKSETRMIKELNLNEKFIFQFAGNLGHAQGLDNILEAIKLIDDNNLHFLFIGAGAKEETIRNFIEKNSRNNVTLVGFQNRNEQNDFLNACDIAIVTLNEGMFGLGVPSKSYNIMAAGKPIIIVADKNSEISLTVKEFNLGWVVEPNNPKALKDVFCKAYEDADSNNAIKIRSRQIAENNFAKDIILNKYLALFS